ncbi:MAG: type II toxin-antitoxin system RelE/ParE family toxin [Gemmataceae bacterium]|nr:type II toxin-antitoxin system RelE/ParE family toxin [Gemmataceae bacterium]
MSLRVLPLARDDISRAAAWHERHRPGSGQDCTDAIEASLHSISTFPRIGTAVSPAIPGREIRRVVVQGFPYLVFYELDGDDAIIFAVEHQRRRPGGWVTRLP